MYTLVEIFQCYIISSFVVTLKGFLLMVQKLEKLSASLLSVYCTFSVFVGLIPRLTASRFVAIFVLLFGVFLQPKY